MTTPAAEDLAWRRVHPITPVVRGWTILAAALFVVGQQSIDDSARGGGIVELLRSDFWWIVPAAIVLVALVGFGYAAVAWRMTSYAVGEDTVHMRKGVLFRTQRHARLDRVQAVDIRQPLVARLFGLCELTLEVAGGSDSGIAIGFLRDGDARALRGELLARAAGLKAHRTGEPLPDVGARPPADAPLPAGADGPVDTAQAADHVPGVVHPGEPTADQGFAPELLERPGLLEAPEQSVLTVPPARLIVSLLRSGAAIFTFVFVVALVVLVITTGRIGIAFSVLPALLGGGGYLFNRFTGEFDFRVAISADGIRLRHGLLETRAQTIPPGRVQAVSLTQGLLWRGPDWWRVQVNVAGYGDKNETNAVLLPVGTREDALAVLSLVLPELGVDEPRALLDEGLEGDSSSAGRFVGSPRRARILDPVSWRRHGFSVTGRALLLRRGRLVRALDVVPHERTQSLAVTQGPWQRRLGLATFTVHSTPGPVSPAAPHLDAADAARLLDEQALRARSARAAAGPERWMETS
ncbi:PH domain-containing protein [Antribacter gilvus]|uniref:PH domain-containing protein n=1 Tax=Antribacter gilvus TaxID=2304675 RepID=UPI000F7A1954|nr:PH domain-containing protein [Antribacter gilvus]